MKIKFQKNFSIKLMGLISKRNTIDGIYFKMKHQGFLKGKAPGNAGRSVLGVTRH
jgi:hypothetical protein